MPTGRAPTPILRKVPDEVPTRWPPREVWAQARSTEAKPAAARSTAPARRTLEVIVEAHPPLRRRQIVGGIPEGADQQGLARGGVEGGEPAGIEEAHSRLVAAAGVGID